ncbi:hypothetical protein, partial [Xylella fastidiosa]|uniref:hypothetical protein n=1 Tax=Xylella fastidiosa TaxID=2371 RepID=UPI003F6E0558
MADLPALIRAEAGQWRLKATDTEDGKAKNEKIAAALDARSKKSEMGSAIETLERLLKKRPRAPLEQLDTNP